MIPTAKCPQGVALARHAGWKDAMAGRPRRCTGSYLDFYRHSYEAAFIEKERRTAMNPKTHTPRL